MTVELVQRKANRLAWPFWLYLLLISVAELLTSLVDLKLGLTLHAAILVGLLLHSALGTREEVRRLMLALVLAPLIRLLSLGLPIGRLPQMAWYPVVALPLLAAAWLIIRQAGVSRRELGLRWGTLPLQLALIPGGLGLGALEYAILRPAQQIPTLSWSIVLLSSLSLLIFTGFAEELIFRGLLQALAPPVLGQWGLIGVALLFGVLHIGYLSLADVIFVTTVGLLFAQIVYWSGSIIGVTLAHGVTNIVLFILMPHIVEQMPQASMDITWLFIFFGLMAFVIVLSITAQQRLSTPHAMHPVRYKQIRELRARHNLSRTDIALRTGLPLRRVAEVEFGLHAPQPEELRLFAQVFGIEPQQLLAPKQV